MGKDSLLLQPIQVGNLTLKNRIMFPPLTTGYEERDGSIGTRSLAFYERLAKGGASYIVIGDVAPVQTASPTPKLADDRQIPAFKTLADTLHKYDCKVALQLFHPEYDVPGVGRMIMASRMAMMEAQKLKEAGDMAGFGAKMQEMKKLSDEAYAKLHHDMKHFVSEATQDQLNQIKNAIAQAARRAQEANIDAIEVHGDRLLGSLCSTLLNHRDDEYGGSFENRIRYALEVVAAIKEAAPNLMIEYKLPVITINADGSLRGKGGLLEDEAVAFAIELEKAGVDMIQVAQANHTGNMGDTIPPMGSMPYNWTLPAAKKVKAVVNVPIATVGRVVSVANGEQILKDNDADIIGYGRSLLCDPDIALKVANDEPIRECLNCNKGCVDAIQGRRYISCVLNAENGDESTISIKASEGKKNIAVIGGGIAGLEATRVACAKGYHVDLFEKTNKLGGQINIAAVPPRKDEIMRSVEYYEKILPSMDAIVYLEAEVDPKELNKYDAVICAIGASNVSIPIEGAQYALSSWDILDGSVEVSGNVVVIGGGLVGAESAEYLASKGCKVSVVEMMEKIASQESSTVLPLLMAEYAKYGVAQYVNTQVKGIYEEGKLVKAFDTKAEKDIEIACDYVVMAVGSKKNTLDLSAVTTPVYYVGDCSGERTADIASAIRSGYNAANEI